ncbi:MAG: TetR/AcrR family transcriptional regulator [Solirubrobacteraceae bacterium]
MSFAAPLTGGMVTPGRRRFSTRQEEVLRDIEPIFLRDGIRGIRMGDLATEVGCSRSTLYEIAPSKEDLLLLVLDRMMDRISRRGAEAIAGADTHVARMSAMMESGVADFAALGPRFLDAVRSHPPARMLFDRWVGVCRDALEQMIDDAVLAGEIRPVNGPVVAEMMFSAVLRFTEPEFTRALKVGLAEALEQIIDVLLHGLRPR